MELKLCAITSSIIFGLFLLIPSVNMHELGHAIAYIGQGFELFEINFLASYVRCSDSNNQLVDIMGGATGSISMLSFLFVKRIRNCLPIALGFTAAALTQFLNMILEGFLNPIYVEFDLENLVLVLGIGIIISLVTRYRSNLKESYSIKIEFYSIKIKKIEKK